MKEITYGVAVSAYGLLIKQHSANEVFDTQAVETLAFAVNNDLQIRDYLLGGLPTDLGAESAITFITDLLPLIDESARAPFYTLMSAFYYEVGDKDLATASLVQAEVLNPNYPLAHLLTRFFDSGVPSDALAHMRGELHPKVVETIESNLDLVIA